MTKMNTTTKKNNRRLSKRKRKINITVYFALRILVIISLVGQAIRGNWNNVFLCILTLILFTMPTFLSKKFHATLPTTLEIIVYLFIYSAEILGEIQNFYGIFSHWDTMLHTLNGFLCAGVGFSLIDILNHNENFHINMSPAFAALVAFCFSMTIGVMWEFGEFTVDQCLNKDMQKDRVVDKISSVKLKDDNSNEPMIIENINQTMIYYDNNNVIVVNNGYLDIGIIDTMKDLFVNFLGAFVFSILGYLYTKNKEGYRFTEIFLPKFISKNE